MASGTTQPNFISMLEVLFDKFKLRFETEDFSKIGKSLEAKTAHSEGEAVTSIAEGFCFCSRLESGSGTIFVSQIFIFKTDPILFMMTN